ncbi:DUF1385 domain-containing protein [Adlercreutzia faecimuris]|uniref:DUF1385 domain-containing protein n=1 Tax=Adlercreutzia faecimuris TaxID=2897341 RepID=A0ABS9WG07_9ACTN|nr:DUF1385 domain-containing protein [Adlercreutzia sp. JBNU-10]MCI2241799.1 DUF1385 domain-containing protein [Adlercreutzia sp. JBNU-10]
MERRSDLSRAFSEDGARKTHVGGQALIEGVMMRGRYNWAVAVREPDGGIYVEEHDLASGADRNGWMHWPLVRGCRALVESLMLGYKALEIAALHAFGDEEGAPRAAGEAPAAEGPAEAETGAGASAEAPRPAPMPDPAGLAGDDGSYEAREDEGRFSWQRDFGRPEVMVDALGAQRTLEVVGDAPAVPAPPSAGAPRPAPAPEAPAADGAGKGESFGKREMALSMVLGLVLGVVLFIVAPAFITNLIVGEYDQRTVLWNVVDGLLRVAVFVFYLWLIGRMEDIRRMFMYHGAEHKTIHCYEHELPLTPKNARSFPRLHVRCGTAFLIMVMVIAIFVYTIFPVNALIDAWGVPNGAPKLALVILVRILLMPLIAGLSYEITVKWAGSHPDNPLVRVILWPGMQMQYLTTNEPDDEQLACAIAAMERVLAREEAEARAMTPAEARATSVR